MVHSAPEPADVVAAGAVVTRENGDVLLVHRPKYDDWSFPKGKLDPGEHVTTAAVREVAEETGLDIRLGPALSTRRYAVNHGKPRTKQVHYWVGWAQGDDDVSSYQRPGEIDEVLWLPRQEARERLHYDHDRATLEESGDFQEPSWPLVILRHSRATRRMAWSGDDRDRPLTEAGAFQAEQLAPVLGAYRIDRVLSSTSRRCWATVAPYAEMVGVKPEVTDELTEEHATPEAVAKHVRRLLDHPDPAVLCTHRPVLPMVFEALGLEPYELEPGGMFVVHHRRSRIVATEQHYVSFQ